MIFLSSYFSLKQGNEFFFQSCMKRQTIWWWWWSTAWSLRTYRELLGEEDWEGNWWSQKHNEVARHNQSSTQSTSQFCEDFWLLITPIMGFWSTGSSHQNRCALQECKKLISCWKRYRRETLSRINTNEVDFGFKTLQSKWSETLTLFFFLHFFIIRWRAFYNTIYSSQVIYVRDISVPVNLFPNNRYQFKSLKQGVSIKHFNSHWNKAKQGQNAGKNPGKRLREDETTTAPANWCLQKDNQATSWLGIIYQK